MELNFCTYGLGQNFVRTKVKYISLFSDIVLLSYDLHPVAIHTHQFKTCEKKKMWHDVLMTQKIVLLIILIWFTYLIDKIHILQFSFSLTIKEGNLYVWSHWNGTFIQDPIAQTDISKPHSSFIICFRKILSFYHHKVYI